MNYDKYKKINEKRNKKKKTPLTEEQLLYIDKMLMNPCLNKWVDTWPRAIYDFPAITKLLEEKEDE